MDAQNIKALIGKLNTTLTKAMEAAAGTCIQRTHYEISIEHCLLKLLDQPKSDIALIAEGTGSSVGDVMADLNTSLDQLKSGNYSKPRFSSMLLESFAQAWNFGSLERGEKKIRSGHILVALLRDQIWLSSSPIRAFKDMSEADIVARFDDLTAAGDEAPRRAQMPSQAPGILDEFTINITQQAKDGSIDPVVGRDHEIHQVIDILSRRRKNNPILVGEPGVGKSAIVEGLALHIVEGRVPPILANVEMRNLDLGMLKAGASMKGEFEERLKNVIDAVQNSPTKVILFIDEAHTLIGAGGAAGSGDAANLLKPALARGQLRTVAATTWSEYKKYIEKDPALERRFQLIKIDEPDVAKATLMLRGLKPKYEDHHNVKILDSALEAAADLSAKYLSGRQLPDKAIDLLDTACARVRLSLTSQPYDITRIENEIFSLESAIAGKELDVSLTGQDASEALSELNQQLQDAQKKLAEAQEKWDKEKALVEKILELEKAVAGPTGEAADEAQEDASQAEATESDEETQAQPAAPAMDLEQAQSKLREVQKEWEDLSGESPLVEYRVSATTISQIVSQWTGIPVGAMVKDELADVINIVDRLKLRVLGQDHAAERIARAIKTSKAKVNNPNTPIGVFLAVGPSGTGKTEMALTLADALFGGERFTVQINMSEYQEKHTVSRLIGSPPGYVGYGEGGVLSEAVRQRPYSVVLLDEVEKGHPDVMNLFYQVFDKGHLADGEGRVIDFKNTIIMMTSNLGSQIIEDMCAGDEWPEATDLLDSIRPTLNQFLKPALLARMTVLPYFPISDTVMKKIVGLKLRKIVKRLKQNHDMTTRVEPAVLDFISQRCRLVEAGARNIDQILNAEILPMIATEILTQLMEGEVKSQLTLGVEDEQFTLEFE